MRLDFLKAAGFRNNHPSTGLACLVQTRHLAKCRKTLTRRRYSSPVASAFIIITFFFLLTTLSVAQLSEDKTLKPAEFGGRRILVRKRCPPPKCCNVVEHVTRTRGAATKELGKALRNSIERGRSIHEVAMKTTKTEALGGLEDRKAAETLLEEKARADASVAEQKAAVAEKELSQIEKADKHSEEKEEEFERHRITEEEAEVKRQQQLADSLAAEEKKLTHALEEELAVLEKEVGAAEADKEAADAHLDALVSEAAGEQSHQEAKQQKEEAERHAEHEKEELARKEATRVAAIARHLTKETAEKLQDLTDSVELTEPVEAAESMGEAEANVLEDIQKAEEEVALAEAEEAETTHDEGELEEEGGDEMHAGKKRGKDQEEEEAEEEADDESFLVVKNSAEKDALSHSRTRKRRLKEHRNEIVEELLPKTELSWNSRKPKEAAEPLDAEPRVEEGEEDLPDLWFGNKGADETLEQSNSQPKEIKLSWWRRIFG